MLLGSVSGSQVGVWHGIPHRLLAAALWVSLQIKVRNWAGRGPNWPVLFLAEPIKVWAQTCGHVFTHSSAHWGFITDCGQSLPTRQLEMTSAERRAVVSGGWWAIPGSGVTASSLWALDCCSQTRGGRERSSVTWRSQAVLRPPYWHLTLEGRTEQEGLFPRAVSSCLGSQCSSTQAAVHPALELWSLF